MNGQLRESDDDLIAYFASEKAEILVSAMSETGEVRNQARIPEHHFGSCDRHSPSYLEGLDALERAMNRGDVCYFFGVGPYKVGAVCREDREVYLIPC